MTEPGPPWKDVRMRGFQDRAEVADFVRRMQSSLEQEGREA